MLETAEKQKLRLDKWLWHARFCKSRTLAAKFIAEGRVRVNARKETQAAKAVSPGDCLTLTLPRAIVVCRIRALGNRRGPASEARALYTIESNIEPPTLRQRQVLP